MTRTKRDGDPSSTTLEERLAEASARLTVSERRVARYFQEHAAELMSQSAAKIAAALRVSDATVVRTAKVLGYSGLPELKRELWFATRALGALRLRRRLDQIGDESDDELLEHIIGSQIEMLQEARTTLAPKDFHQAVDLLARAKRVITLGIHYGPIAEHMAQTVRRYGLQAHAIVGRGSNLPENLMELTSGDVLVVITSDLHVREIDIAVAHAAAQGIPRILVSDTKPAARAGSFDVMLYVREGSHLDIPKHPALLIVVEALLLGLARRKPKSSVAAMERLGHLREAFEGWPRSRR